MFVCNNCDNELRFTPIRIDLREKPDSKYETLYFCSYSCMSEYSWRRYAACPSRQLAPRHTVWKSYDEAAVLIADLFAMTHDAPAKCGHFENPQEAALQWLRNWRASGADAAANSFAGRWLLEGPPPWPDTGHIPHS